MTDFICNIKRYRQLEDLTQEQLAERVGVRRETIMRLEAGKYNPSLKLAVDISRVLDTPIEELFVFKTL
ncbi:MAG TPA: transcriptional regulator [Ruminococcaceae bacterium]|jgi:DNA-binding XRE family transcriptional regulator|nr:transcriptional regulator [Oscillospiraceae bacterium]